MLGRDVIVVVVVLLSYTIVTTAVVVIVACRWPRHGTAQDTFLQHLLGLFALGLEMLQDRRILPTSLEQVRNTLSYVFTKSWHTHCPHTLFQKQLGTSRHWLSRKRCRCPTMCLASRYRVRQTPATS